MAQQLFPMLSIARAVNRNDWLLCGWICYNISVGNEDGLTLWLDHSSRAPDVYSEDICISEWSKMTKRDVGMGTLRFFASQDDPAAYAKFKKQYSKKHVEQSLSLFTYSSYLGWLRCTISLNCVETLTHMHQLEIGAVNPASNDIDIDRCHW